MNGSVTLKRSLSLPMLVLYGLGTTIGAGIYALIGEIAGVAGYLAPFSFLLAALLAGVTALSFAELAARFPRAAGEALYVREGVGSITLSTFTGLLVVGLGLLASHEPEVRRIGLVAALIARAAKLGLTVAPTGEETERARTEGWIHVPEQWSLPRLAHGEIQPGLEL